jgi:hypothetical protein
MKCITAGTIAIGLLLCAISIWVAGGFASAASGPAGNQADQALTQALATGGQTAVADLLDSNFAWTDADGKTRTKEETLRDLKTFAADNPTDTDVKTLSYGDLDVLSGTHHNARFVRLWVKRPAGWRAFVDLDTPIPAEARPGPEARAAGGGTAGDCNNPCRTLPFQPTTRADKEVLAEWQKTKVDEWHPDANDWAAHIADEFMIINNGSERDKADRVALAKKQQAAGIGSPGAPILSMTMYDFSSSVVMISHHVPYQGGKPYYNVRVFVSRDGHWPLVWSQQTTIQSAATQPGPRVSE